MRISDFHATLRSHKGVANNNRYEVIFSLPSTASVGGFNSRDINMLCDSIVLPGRNVSTLDYMNHKQGQKIPYTFINSDVTAEFILTNDYYARRVFEAWSKAIIDPETYRIKYKNTYTMDVIIRQLDREGNVVFTIVLQDAYPTNINEITLGNAQENEVTKLSVNFSYENFVSL